MPSASYSIALSPLTCPWSVSHFDVPGEEFAMAEIASGFNKRTLISPLHAALIAAAVSNEGVIMAPWLVKSVRDSEGHILYEAEPNVLARPIQGSTAQSLRDLMSVTANEGTARSAFRPLQRNKTFRDFDFGAKDRLDQRSYQSVPSGLACGLCAAGLRPRRVERGGPGRSRRETGDSG
jgi:hypothetical protein